MINETTARGYPKPYADNPLYFDCDRIRDTFDMIDEDMTALETQTSAAISAMQTNTNEAIAGVATATNAAVDKLKAITTGNSNLEYSNSKVYAVGDYCNRDGRLYRCISEITFAEEWTPTHWLEVAILDELRTLAESNTANATSIAALMNLVENSYVLIVNFTEEFEGAEYTVTGDGAIRTGIVPNTRTAKVYVSQGDTVYTVSASHDSTLYSTTIATGSSYGQYTGTLTAFLATLKVTTLAGATVTVSNAKRTYTETANSSGLATFTIKEAGTCAITASNGVRTGSASANVSTHGGTYNVAAKLKIPAVPSQSTALVYSGGSQSPSWNNYDSDELTLNGTTSGTNAGTYTATFTPKAGYQWNDGAATAKNVNWTIGKAAGSLTLDKTTLVLTGETSTGTITVTRAGDGAITAVSSDTSVATVSVSGATITVTAIDEGNATVTVSVTVGTNHDAPSGKICAVTASDFGAKANTSPRAGITYTNGIAGLTPQELSEFAKAISNNASITNETSVVYVDKRAVHRKISVGDSINISFGSEVRATKIMGFNHYELSTSTVYGGVTATGKAGLLFQTVDCLNTKYKMNNETEYSDAKGWKNTDLRATLENTIKNTMPESWRNSIKTVKRQVALKGGDSGTVAVMEEWVGTHNDIVFLPTLAEVLNMSSYNTFNGVQCSSIKLGYEGIQYAYYKAGNSELKKVNGTEDIWWTSSAVVSHDAADNNFMVVFAGYNVIFSTSLSRAVTVNGVWGKKGTELLGVAPCFCI